MPSVWSQQRKKFDSFYSQEVYIVQKSATDNFYSSTKSNECMKLLKSPVKTSRTLGIHSSCAPSVDQCQPPQDMNTGSNPNLSQGHPIDELTNVPIDPNSRSGQLLLPAPNNSSSEYGPFVSGLPDEFRPRSSSFNTSLLRGQSRPANHAASSAAVDPIRRYSESRPLTKTGSADNVTTPTQQGPLLRHSHTVPEIPPHSLSNDSGYHTPPNRPHPHTSPWTQVQWPAHVSPPGGMPAHQYFPTGRPVPAQRISAPLPLNQNLTIDTGEAADHYQPEPSTPQIMVGPPSYPHPTSMQPPHYMTPNYPRGHDPYTSLPPSQAGTPKTPEEVNICGYQQDRKGRLISAFQIEEKDVASLKAEADQLMQLLEEELKNNLCTNNNEMEKEVINMANVNRGVALELQRLTQQLPQQLPSGPRGGYIPSNPHLPSPPPVPQVTPVVPIPPPIVYPPSPQQSIPMPYSGSSEDMINNTTPTVPVRVAPPIPPRRPSPTRVVDEDEWSCSQCTFLNHPLISSCEMCQTHRQSRPGNSDTTTPLVKVSTCQHQSGCFCHAHLG